jgi:hypothetical protein
VRQRGYALWSALEVMPQDLHVEKTRFRVFIQGSSDIERVLRERGIDTVLIAGTVTNVCCESTARDAMMRNFRTIMVTDANAAKLDPEEIRTKQHETADYFLERGEPGAAEIILNLLDPDYLEAKDLILIGAPDTVARKLRARAESAIAPLIRSPRQRERAVCTEFRGQSISLSSC